MRVQAWHSGSDNRRSASEYSGTILARRDRSLRMKLHVKRTVRGSIW